jgi:hypothetical protein
LDFSEKSYHGLKARAILSEKLFVPPPRQYIGAPGGHPSTGLKTCGILAEQ